MSINNTSERRAGPYPTNGVTTAFQFEFKVFAEEDLAVVSSEDGVDTELTLTTDYTVTLNGDQEDDPGGEITMVAAPDGPTITIISDMDYTQPTTFTNTGGFYPRVLNNSLDRVTILVQQLKELVSRALVAPFGSEAQVGQFPVVLADGTYGYSSGTGADAGLRTDLAGSGGTTYVGFSQAGTGVVARSVQAKLRDVLSVKDFGAVGDGVAADGAPIALALAAAAALANGADVLVPPGTYACGATGLTVGSKVRLVLDGAKITSSAVNAITVVTGNDGATGSIIGSGHNSMIDHTGTGSGVLTSGIASQADLHLSNFWIKGSAAGVAALTLDRFNRATTNGLKMTGYTAGDACRSVGANSITHFAPEISSCLNGIHNLTSSTGGTFTSNVIVVVGGQITNCTGWAWYEDTSGAAGRNLGNRAIGVTFEANGTHGSAVTGDVFNQNCDSLSLESCYFENGAIVPTNCIINGDATNGPKGLSVVGNVFQTSHTNTINDVNGQTTIVRGNVQNGANTNFMQHGTLARGLFLGPDRVASTNYFAGSDTGVDSVIVGSSGTAANQQGPSVTGYGFASLTGFNQDLRIRTRAGGTYNTLWQAIDGTGIGSLDNAGNLNMAAFQVASLQVVGARGAALPVDATDLASAIALVNAIKARMKATGGHGLVAD
jgi:hypothetical protein